MDPSPRPSGQPSPQATPQRQSGYQSQLSTETERWLFERWLEQSVLERKQREERAVAMRARFQTGLDAWATQRAGVAVEAMDPAERALAFAQYRTGLALEQSEEESAVLNELAVQYCPPQVAAAPLQLQAATRMLQAALKWSYGQVAVLLGSARFLDSALALPAAAQAKYSEVMGFLRRSRLATPPISMKSAVGVYQAEGKTILHATRSDGQSVLLEIPALVQDQRVVAKMLRRLREVFRSATEGSDPLAVIDGAMPELNFKELYPDRVVLRTMQPESRGLEVKMQRLYSQSALSARNTNIFNAIPQGFVETAVVFKAQPGGAPVPVAQVKASARLWSGLKTRWESSANRQGFEVAQASKTGFLHSLVEQSNVVVLVAHADSDNLWFPGPPPDGSVVTHEDIRTIADGVRGNAPTIYMYCCEAADAERLENWASVLLDAGATAVVASHGKISAVKSRKLFESFLKFGTQGTPVEALRNAEAKTRQRYLQTWVG